MGHGVVGRAGERRAGREACIRQGWADHVGDLVVRHRDRRGQRRIARIGDVIGIGDDVARGHECRRGGALDDVEARRERGVDGQADGRGHGGPAGGGRNIGHAARVDVGLGDGVVARALQRRARLQRAGIAGHVGDLVVGHGDGVGERDIAGIGHGIGVAHDLSGSVQRRRLGRLHDRERGLLRGGHGDRVGRGRRARADLRGRDVGDRARVEIGLGDGVRSRAGQARIRDEAARRQRGTNDAVDTVVRHGDGVRQGHVAGVADGVAVGERVARRGKGRALRGLVDRVGRRLRAVHGRAFGWRCGRAVGCGRRVGDEARIEVGLAHRIGARAQQGRARREAAHRQGRTGHGRDAVVSNGDRRREGDIAEIGHAVLIGERVADGVEARGRRGLDQTQCGLSVSRHGFGHGIGDSRAVRCRRGVGHGSGIEIGLADRIRRRADEARAREQAPGRQCGAAHGCDPVVRHGDRRGDGDVARIGDRIVIGERVAHRREARFARGLEQRQRRRLRAVHGLGNGRRHGRAVGRAGRVGHGACVEVGLGDCVGRRAEQGLAGGEAARWQGRTGDRADAVIRDRDRIGDRHIPRIGHDEFIVQHIARRGEVIAARELGEGERRRLHGWNRDGHAAGHGRAGTRRGAVGDLARIDIGLGHGVRARACQARAGGEAARWEGRTHHVVDARVRHLDGQPQRRIAGVGHGVAVVERCADGCEVSRVGRFHEAQRRVLVGGQRHENGRRAGARVVGIGVVCQAAQIDIGLSDRVVRRAGLDLAGHEVAREAVDRADLVVLDRNAPCQGDIARVLDLERIADDLADSRIGGRGRRLADFQRGVGVGGDGFRVWRRRDAARRSGGDVGHHAHVERVLRDCEVGRAGQRRRGREPARWQGGADDIGDAVVGHRDRVDHGDVAGVGHDVFVAHDVARQGEGDARRGLVDGQRGAARGEDALLDGRADDRAVRGGGKVDHHARIDVGLGHSVVRFAGQRVAGCEPAAWAGGTAHGRDLVVRDRNGTAQRDIARIGDVVLIAHGLAGGAEGLVERALDDGQRRALIGGHGRADGCRSRRAVRGRRRVGHETCIEIRLRGHVHGRADEAFARRETAHG